MKTAARKKTGQASAAGVVGVGLLGVALAAYPTGKGGAVAAAFFGLMLIALAWFSFWEADCPSCGKAVPLPASDHLKCPHCRLYSRRLPGQLESVADDTVGASPLFAIPLEGAKLPDLCCVCGAPASRRTTLSALMADDFPAKTTAEGMKKNAAMGAGMRPTLKAAIDVPHCGTHDADAKIDRDEAPSGPLEGGGTAHVVLRVRSYPFYRAALGL